MSTTDKPPVLVRIDADIINDLLEFYFPGKYTTIGEKVGHALSAYMDFVEAEKAVKQDNTG